MSYGPEEDPATRPKPSLYGGNVGQGIQPDEYANLESLLAKLEEPMRPVPQPKTWQKVLAVIGDAMVAYGGGRGGAVQAVTEPTRQAEAENMQAAARNRETRRGLIAETFKSKLQLDQKVAEEKRAEDKAVRLKELEESLNNKASAIAAYLDLYKLPGFVAPDGEDIRNMSQERVLQLRNEYAKSHPVENAQDILNKAMSAQGGQDAQVSVSTPLPGGGTMTATEKKPEPPEVTPQMERDARRVGIDPTGMSKADLSSAIAAANKKEQEAKLKRIGRRTERGNKVGDEIRQLNDMKRAALKAIEFIASEPESSGAEVGMLPDTILKLRGDDALTKKATLNFYLGKLDQIQTRLLSGAAVSEHEGIRLGKTIPKLEDYLDVKKTKLRLMVEEINSAINDRRGSGEGRITDGDMDYIEDPDFIPTTLSDKAITLGDTN